jgi:hypothetical protein
MEQWDGEHDDIIPFKRRSVEPRMQLNSGDQQSTVSAYRPLGLAGCPSGKEEQRWVLRTYHNIGSWSTSIFSQQITESQVTGLEFDPMALFLLFE